MKRYSSTGSGSDETAAAMPPSGMFSMPPYTSPAMHANIKGPTAKVRPEQGLLGMRKKLGLFANIRPVQTFKCLLHKSPLRAELVDGADSVSYTHLRGAA